MGKPDETRTGMRVRLPRIEFSLRSLRARRVMPVVTGAPTVAAGGGKKGGGSQWIDYYLTWYTCNYRPLTESHGHDANSERYLASTYLPEGGRYVSYCSPGGCIPKTMGVSRGRREIKTFAVPHPPSRPECIERRSETCDKTNDGPDVVIHFRESRLQSVGAGVICNSACLMRG